MKLSSNLQYPLLKFLSEEFAGVFYQNEITCLNRMLILYHNRHIFSVDNNTTKYLDDYESYLEKGFNYWYLSGSKRQRINLIRTRILYIVRNNRRILEQLLAREDYSSFKASNQTITKIYYWLQTLPHRINSEAGIDINQWKLDLRSEFACKRRES